MIVDLYRARLLAVGMRPLRLVAACFGIVYSLSGCTEVQTKNNEKMMIDAPTDVGGVPQDAERSASGLAWKVLQQGDGGAKPERTSTVTVHYAGWTEGVAMMTVGEKRRFWIPAKLAYGEAPPPGAPKGMLVFDVELFEIQ